MATPIRLLHRFRTSIAAFLSFFHPMLVALLEEYLPATSFHSIFVFAVQVILGFLALNYVGQNNSPFKTHPKTLQFSLISLLLYCLTYIGAQLATSPTPTPTPTPTIYYVNACSRLMVWFGSMLLASLASVCFSDYLQWPFFVLSALFCMAAPSHTLLQKLWSFIHPTPTPTQTIPPPPADLEAGQPPCLKPL